MNYDDAEQKMRDGYAVARAAWEGKLYLFLDRERIWARYRNGHLHYCMHLQLQRSRQDDWLVVENPNGPLTVPPAKPPKKSNRLYFGDKLAAKQTEMRARRTALKVVGKD